MAVRRGFHRVGLVIAIPCAILTTIALVLSLYRYITLPPEGIWIARGPSPDYQEFRMPDPPSVADAISLMSDHYKRSVTAGEIRWSYPRDEATRWMIDSIVFAVSSAIAGLVGYLISWVIGWVIAGFKSDAA